MFNRRKPGLGAVLTFLTVFLLCCGGDEGTVSTVPPSPVLTEPPPQAPEAPTNGRVVEYGQTFLGWEWDPVEGATGYEVVVFPEGTPVPERPPSSIVSEPTYLAEGLEPNTTWELVIRALRETAGGRAASPWVGRFSGSTWGEPRECTTEREDALAYKTNSRGDDKGPVLVKEWDGTPFLFYFNRDGLPESEEADAERGSGGCDATVRSH